MLHYFICMCNEYTCVFKQYVRVKSYLNHFCGSLAAKATWSDKMKNKQVFFKENRNTTFSFYFYISFSSGKKRRTRRRKVSQSKVYFCFALFFFILLLFAHFCKMEIKYPIWKSDKNMQNKRQMCKRNHKRDTCMCNLQILHRAHTYTILLKDKRSLKTQLDWGTKPPKKKTTYNTSQCFSAFHLQLFLALNGLWGSKRKSLYSGLHLITLFVCVCVCIVWVYALNGAHHYPLNTHADKLYWLFGGLCYCVCILISGQSGLVTLEARAHIFLALDNNKCRLKVNQIIHCVVLEVTFYLSSTLPTS